MADLSSLVGVLPLYKPRGLTSAHVLDRLKAAWRRSGVKPKVGHGGTLDKLAEGLLLVLVGPATRWFDDIGRMDKQYLAEVRLDAFSTTDDAEGPLQPVAVATWPAPEAVHAAAQRFTGEIEQHPPAFSRVHVSGQRADDIARKAVAQGVAVERPAARRVRIDRITIAAYQPPSLRLDVVCSGGTYIRSLARDLGGTLGVGGYLGGLVRTRIGVFTLEHAVRVDAERVIEPDQARAWLNLLQSLDATPAMRG